jgi:methyltransferase (TIGR00027 family)
MSARAAIKNVADTALWMAAVRAAEGERSDAAFHDPLGAILAGDRGRKIARSFSRTAMIAWGVVLRTTAIDRLIHEALESGVDTVLNLGAGLDTRPYRMDLPSKLRWIEIDLPAMVETKNAQLAGYTPVCSVERIGMDLSEGSARNGLFAKYAATSTSMLVITEGFISYFSNDEIEVLAKELLALPSAAFWIQDFDNAGARKMPKGWAKKLEAAPFRFRVSNWFEFFKQSGWQPHKIISCADESKRINRPYPLDLPFGLLMRALPKEMSEKIKGLSGAVMMKPSVVSSTPQLQA